MSGNYNLVMGDRGRLVVPIDTREEYGWRKGTPMVMVKGDDCVTLMSRDALLKRVRTDYAGSSLVDSLIADRREAAAQDLDEAGEFSLANQLRAQAQELRAGQSGAS
jgi:bifunctional DNA-binding transcriptional regulator/antitoxin component of YhaV-PrlF toxin-antitoxin module